VTYYRKKGGVAIAEIWYNSEEQPEKKVDLIKYRFVEKKQKRASSLEELFTLVLDLKNDDEKLFARIGKSTRYEINRARERDNIECYTFLGQDEKNREKAARYIDYFNEFTSQKNRSEIDFSDLEQFINNNTLCIRCAASADRSVVFSMHAYVVSDGRARLHQSSSHFRKSDNSEFRRLIGRANRLLHWDDMVYFKNTGLAYYDFGGWYGGQRDKEKLAINEFKESFGGEKHQEYSYLVPKTFLGITAAGGHGILKAVRDYKKNRKSRSSPVSGEGR
jgi:lipid II:glycine glycyltransferase (peptidoglycan interpeptide bridge formation enzyme)